MKIGTTSYYRMRSDGSFVRDASQDCNTPCHIDDKSCGPNEMQAWCCTNADDERRIAAGSAVRRRYGSDAAIAEAMQQ